MKEKAQIIKRNETTGQRYFYYADGLGSIRYITDQNRNVVNSYTYDSFGNIIDSTEGIENPYTFTGREWEPSLGLYYYRNRWYDPTIGRFISEDPIGFAGGINFYAYVGNNPGSFIDPWGLQQFNVGSFVGGLQDAKDDWEIDMFKIKIDFKGSRRK